VLSPGHSAPESTLLASLSGGGPHKVRIDPNGNLATKTGGSDNWTYEWNAENQLTKVQKNGAEVARFAYDPLGRRVEKAAAGVTTSYTYDRVNILREAEGTATVKYVHGSRSDEELAVDGGAAPSFSHADAHGSIVKTTDAVGTVTATRQYDAWGNLQSYQNRPVPGLNIDAILMHLSDPTGTAVSSTALGAEPPVLAESVSLTPPNVCERERSRGLGGCPTELAVNVYRKNRGAKPRRGSGRGVDYAFIGRGFRGGTPSSRSDLRMSTSRRRSRVWGRLALMIQNAQVLRYQGGWAEKKRQAREFARSFATQAGASSRGRLSYEYSGFTRARKAARPAGCMRPSASSWRARAMLTALQALFALRGVKRTLKVLSSTARRTPSIQPMQRASSRASR